MTDILVDGLCFGEGPRWHEDRLWFSDMHADTVFAVDESGQLEPMVRLPDDQPSGLGWLPDGRLLIVAMTSRRLLVHDGETLDEFADLSGHASFYCNDMVTDSQGRSWVGNFGYDLHNGADMKPAELVRVDPDGTVSIAAEEVIFPNGTVITPDGNTLIVGETMAGRLTAFNITDSGELTDRRTFAQLDKAVPDGICLDEAGGIWVASPVSNEVIRVEEGGKVTDRIGLSKGAYACMLGGTDGRTLFIMTSGSSHPDQCRANRDASIECVRVQHAGAGLP
jgi:sugar lactone lactonase YvrE